MRNSVANVFISSTSEDLIECRKEVSEVIIRCNCTPVQMEYFGALSSYPMDVCREKVNNSDIIILIVGNRYGWVPPTRLNGDGERSITWHELEWGIASGKSIFVFLLSPNATWPEEPKKRGYKTANNRLRRFRKYLQEIKTVQFFDSPDELAKHVALSLCFWLLKSVSKEGIEKYLLGSNQEIGLSSSISEDKSNVNRKDLLNDIQRNQEDIDKLLLKRLQKRKDRILTDNNSPWQIIIINDITNTRQEYEYINKNYKVYHTLIYETPIIIQFPTNKLLDLLQIGKELFFDLKSILSKIES